MTKKKSFMGYTVKQLLTRAKSHPDTGQLQVTVRTRVGTTCFLRVRLEAEQAIFGSPFKDLFCMDRPATL